MLFGVFQSGNSADSLKRSLDRIVLLKEQLLSRKTQALADHYAVLQQVREEIKEIEAVHV